MSSSSFTMLFNDPCRGQAMRERPEFYGRPVALEHGKFMLTTHTGVSPDGQLVAVRAIGRTLSVGDEITHTIEGFHVMVGGNVVFSHLDHGVVIMHSTEFAGGGSVQP